MREQQEPRSLTEHAPRYLPGEYPQLDAGAVDAAVTTLDLPRLWGAVARRWRWITAVVVAFVAPSLAYVELAEPVYRSTAVFQIAPESSKVLPYNDPLDPTAAGGGDYELAMKTYDGILKSQVLRNRVVARLSESFPTQSGAALSEGPEIERVEGSQLVSLSYASANPAFAAAAANAWVDGLIEMEAQQQRVKVEQATGFLREQLESLKQQVHDAEGNLIDYARRNAALDLENDGESIVRRRLTQLSDELARAETDLHTQRARRESLHLVAADSGRAGLNDALISDLENRAFRAEQELSALRSTFGDEWPAVADKNKELDLVRDQLERARTAALNDVTIESEVALSAAVKEYNALKSSAEKQAGLVRLLNERLVEYNALDREFQMTNELYRSLMQRLKETAVVAGLERRRVHVVDPAPVPDLPYRPRKALTLLLALSLGLGLGVGASLLMDSWGDHLESSQDIENLGVPVLGSVQDLGPNTSLGQGLSVRLLSESNVSASSSASTSLISRTDATEAQMFAQESFRAVCWSLILSRSGAPPKVILVSSALPKEGKTTTASAVGATFAELGSKTLLIDADLRNPSLTRSLGTGPGEGLSTYLSGGPLKIVATDDPNLFCLPAGPAAPNPMALFSSARMSELLHKLGQEFSYIIIDSPPVLGIADSIVLASQADGVVLVTRVGRTPRKLVRQAITRLQRTGAVTLGAVANRVEHRELNHYDYGRYYSGGARTDAAAT